MKHALPLLLSILAAGMPVKGALAQFVKGNEAGIPDFEDWKRQTASLAESLAAVRPDRFGIDPGSVFAIYFDRSPIAQW